MRRQRKAVHIGTPIGMEGDDDLEPLEGGPSIFAQELSEYRWAAQQEAVNVGRRGLDPERWDQGRMAFDIERALAHGHEGLRDRLANHVGRLLADATRDLYELAGDVAVDYDELAAIDRDLTEVEGHRDHLRKRITSSPKHTSDREIGRYYRHRSELARLIKYTIAAVFIVGEFIITGIVFERVFPDLIEGLGFLLAISLTLALAVVPHYTAVTLKESLPRRRRSAGGAGDDGASAGDDEVDPEEPDRWGRTAAIALGIALIVMILPLSYLRATDREGGISLVELFLFLVLQYVISGYFFMREWNDHDERSSSLNRVTEHRDALERRRSAVIAALSDHVVAFHEEAQELVRMIEQAPRWDSYIVECFLETIRYFRHVLAIQAPEYEEFIVWARVPYLGAVEDEGSQSSSYPLDPLTHEHLSLGEDGPLGREWWYRAANEALREATGLRRAAPPVPGNGSESTDAGPEAAGWLVTKSPPSLLVEFLRRYFDLDLSEGYRRFDLPFQGPDRHDTPGTDAGEHRPEHSTRANGASDPDPAADPAGADDPPPHEGQVT